MYLLKWFIVIFVGMYIIILPGPLDVGELIIDNIADSNCDNQECIDELNRIKTTYFAMAFVFTILASIQLYRFWKARPPMRGM